MPFQQRVWLNPNMVVARIMNGQKGSHMTNQIEKVYSHTTSHHGTVSWLEDWNSIVIGNGVGTTVIKQNKISRFVPRLPLFTVN
jgi:hypothetical protein